MVRYKKYHCLINSYYLSKQSHVFDMFLPRLGKVTLQAGHFKLSSALPEYGLLFASLMGQTPVFQMFTHGKRLKRTILLSADSYYNKNLRIFDRFINIILPHLEDFKSLQLKTLHKGYVTWRLRYYFEWDDTYGFLSDRVLKKGVFIPLFLNCVVVNTSTAGDNFLYLRILRMPLSRY